MKCLLCNNLCWFHALMPSFQPAIPMYFCKLQMLITWPQVVHFYCSLHWVKFCVTCVTINGQKATSWCLEVHASETLYPCTCHVHACWKWSHAGMGWNWSKFLVASVMRCLHWRPPTPSWRLCAWGHVAQIHILVTCNPSRQQMEAGQTMWESTVSWWVKKGNI